MENNNNTVSFMKVPVQLLMDILQNAWDMGADFVDIVGVPDEIQEEISIVVKEEYVSEEEEEGSSENEEDKTDLNDLI